MEYELGIAYGVASLIAVALGYAGARNHRAGYRREREDTVVNVLIAAAGSRADNRKRNSVSTPVVRAQDQSVTMTTGAQLVALNAALTSRSVKEMEGSNVEIIHDGHQ